MSGHEAKMLLVSLKTRAHSTEWSGIGQSMWPEVFQKQKHETELTYLCTLATQLKDHLMGLFYPCPELLSMPLVVLSVTLMTLWQDLPFSCIPLQTRLVGLSSIVNIKTGNDTVLPWIPKEGAVRWCTQLLWLEVLSHLVWGPLLVAVAYTAAEWLIA